MKLFVPFAFAFLTLPLAAFSADAPKPLKVLLVTGGCCHDYKAQKDILKSGIEARANVVVEQQHTDDKTTKASFEIYSKPNWAAGYDVVIHDECSADVKDPAYVESMLAEHKRGVPAVALHCAMHCYRVGEFKKPVTPGSPDALWFDVLGLQSNGHGKQLPISITFLPVKHPITKGMTDWVTIGEELYNNIKIYDDAVPLFRGKQGEGDKPGLNDTVIGWTHLYGEHKTRVFATTLGHNNETVGDARYLDLVTRGVLWAADKLNDDGTAKPGYGVVKK